MTQSRSDDNACLNAAMSLNNIAVSLIDRCCYAKAIEIFCDALTLLKGGHPPEDVVLAFMAKANHYIAGCWQHGPRDAETAESKAAPYFILDEDLVTVARFEFENDLMEMNIPFKCYMVQFAGTFDFTSKVYLVDVVISVVLNNMACTYVSVNMGESGLNDALKGAHELWELSLCSIDAFLYNMQISDNYMKMQQRAMQVLILRCVRETAAVMQIDEVVSAFSTALVDEYLKLRDMQGVLSLVRPDDENAGAA